MEIEVLVDVLLVEVDWLVEVLLEVEEVEVVVPAVGVENVICASPVEI